MLKPEALKQLGIIERTPEPENQNILSGLTLEERRDVLEYARNRKVHNISHSTNDLSVY
jgi:hypothetical protein